MSFRGAGQARLAPEKRKVIALGQLWKIASAKIFPSAANLIEVAAA